MRPPERTYLLCATSAALSLLSILLSGANAQAADDLPTLLRDADRAQQEGRLADAGALYDRASRGWPQDAAAARGACELGLAVAGTGVITPAVGAVCHRAFLMTQGARDMRNKAAALLSEKAKPDLDTLAIAALLADASLKQAPDKPWGYLIRHDIALRLRRADLLATSESDLQRFASEPSVRAALNAPVGRAPASAWLLRLLVVLGLLGTAVHAVAHRRRAVRVRTSLAPAIVIVALLAAAPALAAPLDMPTIKDKESQLSPFKIDDAHPELAVQALFAKSKDPLQLGYLLQDLSVRADDAHKTGDNARAARYYHALSVAAPTPYGPRKECEALEAVGDIPNAIRACRELLQREGVVVSDYVHFVDVVLKNPKPLPELEPKELEAVIAHVEKATSAGTLPVVLRCKVALRFDDSVALDACAAAVSSIPANDPAIISIKWGLAVRHNDKPAALILVERGRRAGMGPDTVLHMLETTEAMDRLPLQRIGIIIGLAVLAMTVVFFAIRLLAADRQRTVNRSPA